MTDLFTRRNDIASSRGKCSKEKWRTSTLVNDGPSEYSRFRISTQQCFKIFDLLE